MLEDIMDTEVMLKSRVSYGTIVEELRELSKSYKEARMALDVGKIFYNGDRIHSYDALGIGRLIYQLPANLCKLFIEEIYGEDLPKEVDEEILHTATVFLDNNLNVSETARQLYIHRNTLVYRIEKLKSATGLDVRVFDDALTFKIATMVSSYMQYIEKQ
jgi:carbohydrate diacid regulator